jgi:hypothetical protein
MNSVEQIEKIRNTGFEKATQNQAYCEMRSLVTGSTIYPAYDESLPKFRDKDIVQIISEMVEQSAVPIRWLDLGCGPDALALTEGKALWGDRIECVGINAKTGQNSNKLAQQNIIFIPRDLQRLRDLVDPNSFQIITACWVFPYLPDPYLVVKQIHESLNRGGLAFINYLPIDQVINGFENRDLMEIFLRNLEKQDITIDRFQTSMWGKYNFVGDVIIEKKELTNLDIPLRYTGQSIPQTIYFDDGDGYQFETVEYAFEL